MSGIASAGGAVAALLLVASCSGATSVDADAPASLPDGSMTAAPAGDANSPGDYPAGRLADVAVPLGYAIELTVLPDREAFDGHVDIAVELRKRSRAIFLHGNRLDVSRASVTTSGGDTVAASYRQISADGVAQLTFERELAAQMLVLEFDYSAPFNSRLHGLYRVEEGGRRYVFTQFESIYARQAFPGFDQPSYKTPFEVTLNVPANHVAIANTLETDSLIREDGLKRVRFAVTEPLPTYLVALAVGEFDVVQGADIPANDIRDRPIPFRGIAVNGKGAQLAHAMRTTGAILAPLEEYFDMAYPYDKLDVLAVPDFEAGAMENVGAITFRENLLLLGDDASVEQRQAYTSVMAHELAHMWFGNIVTMPWWDDIWLNEAFATWMSYKAVAAFDPGQRPELRRLSRLRSAKAEDGLTSARQIREPVVDSHGIVGAFDSITYAKGGAVLNMFESYLGAEVFRDGVRKHMRRFYMANADINDFIDSLVSVSDASLGSAFRSFLEQKGIPRLDVAVDCEAGKVNVVQSRYLPTGSDGNRNMNWQLPVCFRYGVGGESFRQCKLISESSASVRLANADCPDWLMPDADFAGYYQWSLAAGDYARLRASNAPLSESEWLSIGDSAEAGLAGGSLSVGEAWDALAPMAASPMPAVALSPTRLLSYLLEHFGDEPKVAAALRLEAARLYAGRDAGRALSPKFLNSLPRDEERVFYASLLDFMALDVADAGIRASAYERVSEALGEDGLEAGVIAPAALRTALTVAVQDGDDKTREKLLSAFRASRDAEFRNSALKALAATRDPKFAARLRAMTLDGGMRSNEIRTLLRAHFAEPNNRPAAWRWLSDNWTRLGKVMPERHAAQAPDLVKVFCDEAMAKRVSALFAPTKNDYPGGPRRLDKATEYMVVCARRVAAERDQVRARFAPGVRR